MTLGIGPASIYAWCYACVVGKALRDALGFETGALQGDAGTQASWGIIAVSPGGVFQIAGGCVGDVRRRISYTSTTDGTRHFLRRWHHGQSDAVSSFYEFLVESRGKGPVAFTVCSRDSFTLHAPCPQGEITISVQLRPARVH